MTDKAVLIFIAIITSAVVVLALAAIAMAILNVATDPAAIPSFNTPLSVLEACVGA